MNSLAIRRPPDMWQAIESKLSQDGYGVVVDSTYIKSTVDELAQLSGSAYRSPGSTRATFALARDGSCDGFCFVIEDRSNPCCYNLHFVNGHFDMAGDNVRTLDNEFGLYRTSGVDYLAGRKIGVLWKATSSDNTGTRQLGHGVVGRLTTAFGSSRIGRFITGQKL